MSNLLFRQQREELLRKKEKNEMMLKGRGKRDGVRPESPGRRRRLSHRPTLPLRHLNSQRQMASEVSLCRGVPLFWPCIFLIHELSYLKKICFNLFFFFFYPLSLSMLLMLLSLVMNVIVLLLIILVLLLLL